ncbi:MAG: M48 family metalloprotease [Bryobacterales bacterium]
MTCRLSLGLILGSVWVPLAFAQDAPVPFYSAERKIALGRQLAAEIEAGAGLLDDETAVEFVAGLAGQLARAAGADRLQIRVLESAEAKTHALPGGFLLVRSGLVVGTETAAELAGILAHNIAHITARHGTRNASGSLGENMLSSVPLMFLGGWNGSCARTAGSRAPLAWQKVAGGYEEEADLLALGYLDQVGYDPNGLVDGFDRLATEHIPATARMTAAVREKAHEYSASGRTYTTTSSEFVEIRDRLPKPIAGQQNEQTPTLLPAP